jgi:uncharacterized protein
VEGDGVVLRVRVQPRSAREALGGVRDGALVVRLTAPPVEGRANQALARLLARTLGVPPSSLSLLSGEKGRDKRVRVAGLSLDAARRRLAAAVAAP